jgi:hypothetical protein
VPKFLGMEPKTWLWVGGGLVALIVVYYVMRARGGADAGAVGGDLGSGGQGFGGGIGGSSPVSYNPGAPDSGGDAYQQQLNDLDIQAKQEALKEQQAMFTLQQGAYTQQLDFLGKQNALALQGAQKEQEYQLGYEQEAYRTAQAAQEVVTRSVQGKKKVECPKGQHLVVGADGTPMCQDKGGGGFNLSTVFGGIGQIANGLFSGAAAAAPGIGYGAAQAAAGYGLGQAGIPVYGSNNPQYAPPQQTQRRTAPGFTPPFMPQQPGASPIPYNPQTNRGLTYL